MRAIVLAAALLTVAAVESVRPAEAQTDTVTRIRWTRRWGGSSWDRVAAITTDLAGNIYVGGTTRSTDLPANALFPNPRRSSLYRARPAEPGVQAITGLPDSSVNAMAVDAVRDLVYLATGVARLWEPVGGRGPSVVRPDAASPAVLYGVSGGQVVRSNDAGRTWTPMSRFSWVFDVFAHPLRPGIIFAIAVLAGAEGIRLVRSPDGGQAWELPGIAAGRVDFGAGNLTYASDGRNLYISSDDGATWRPVAVPVGVAGNLAADQLRAGVIYLGGYRSADSGKTWVKVTVDWSPFHVAVDPRSGTSWACNNSELRRSTDAGLSWGEYARLRVCNALAVLPSGDVLVGSTSLPQGFVAKFTADGEPVWATYLADEVSAIATNSSGEVFVAGLASSDFPFDDPVPADRTDIAFIARLASDGAKLLYALPFASGPVVRDLAVGSAGAAYIAGTTSLPIPVTPGVAWPEADFTPVSPINPRGVPSRRHHGYAAKVRGNGSGFEYVTYVHLSSGPASVTSLAVDADGNLYVGGSALWKLNQAASDVIWSTTGFISDLAIDRAGNLLSAQGPIVKFGPDGEVLHVTPPEMGEFHRIKVARDGSLAVMGTFPPVITRSLFAAPSEYFHTSFAGRVHSDLNTVLFGSPLPGQDAADVAPPELSAGLIAAGSDAASESSTIADVVLTRFDDEQVEAPLRIDAVLDEATQSPVSLVPRQRIVIRGVGFGALETTRVTVDDLPANVIAAGSGEITIVVPDIPARRGNVALGIESAGRRWPSISAAAAPRLLRLYSGPRRGDVLVIHEDGTVNGPDNPAARGSIVRFPVNGAGYYTVAGNSVVPAEAIHFRIGREYANGVDAQMLPIPGLPGNVLQVKVIVPKNLAAQPNGEPAETDVLVCCYRNRLQ